VSCALLIAVAGLVFANSRHATPLIASGILLNLSSAVLVFNQNAYQAELFPTRLRALAVGFVYSWSRLAGIFSGYLILLLLNFGGVNAVFVVIAGCLGLEALLIATFGPRTRNQPLEVLS
jgi:putative MFS transporter